jgi:hypothetical protein
MPPTMRKGWVHCELEALGARRKFEFWGGLECGRDGCEGREDEHEQDLEISGLEPRFGLAPGAVDGDAGRVGLGIRVADDWLLVVRVSFSSFFLLSSWLNSLADDFKLQMIRTPTASANVTVNVSGNWTENWSRPWPCLPLLYFVSTSSKGINVQPQWHRPY